MIQIKDITEGGVNCRGMKAAVTFVEEKMAKTGSSFLSGGLMDSTGTIDFKVWSNPELMLALLKPGTAVSIESGITDEYQGKVSVKLTNVKSLPAEEVGGLLFQSPIPEKVIYKRLDELVERLKSFDVDLTDGIEKLEKLGMWQQFKTLPAARRHHHAYARGLLVHSLETVSISESIADAIEEWQQVKIDKGVLLAAALLHDLGKIAEYSHTPLGFFEGFSTLGELTGHHVLGALLLDKVFSNSFGNRDRLAHVRHCILSHHGRVEWGAALEPKTIEAFILSRSDDVGAMAPSKDLLVR